MTPSPQIASNHLEDIHRMLDLIKCHAEELRNAESLDKPNQSEWIDSLVAICETGEFIRQKIRAYTYGVEDFPTFPQPFPNASDGNT